MIFQSTFASKVCYNNGGGSVSWLSRRRIAWSEVVKCIDVVSEVLHSLKVLRCVWREADAERGEVQQNRTARLSWEVARVLAIRLGSLVPSAAICLVPTICCNGLRWARAKTFLVIEEECDVLDHGWIDLRCIRVTVRFRLAVWFVDS